MTSVHALTPMRPWVFGRTLAAILLGLGGSCVVEEPLPESPCDDDRFACEAGMLSPDPSCMLAGDLEVEIGWGEDRYMPLHSPQWPEMHSGSQGGQHMFLGARIENAALDRYDNLELQFRIYDDSQCPPPESGVVTPCEDPPLAFRNVVVGGPGRPLSLGDDGSVEEYGIVTVLDVGSATLVIQLRVNDPCGRTGLAQYRG